VSVIPVWARQVKRSLQLEARRAGQRARWRQWDRSGLPVIFGNSMAKSGSHVLSQFLEGLPAITPAVFAAPLPLRTFNPEGRPRPEADVASDLCKFRPGDIAWGYIPSRPAFLEVLTGPGHATFFIYRDPRDKIVSHILYAMDIHPGHAMHDYYQALPSMEARISATIQGVPGMVENIRETYESYLGWLDRDDVLALRFEDAIDHREAALEAMLTYLEARGLPLRVDRQRAKAILNQSMAPERSPTFRQGTSGGWRDHFSPANQEELSRVAGDLMQRLGYLP
jgi:Sulfotransferase domain